MVLASTIAVPPSGFPCGNGLCQNQPESSANAGRASSISPRLSTKMRNLRFRLTEHLPERAAFSLAQAPVSQSACRIKLLEWAKAFQLDRGNAHGLPDRAPHRPGDRSATGRDRGEC